MQARRFRVYAAVTHIELWRRGWDLNPRYPLRYVRFRGGSFQPLTHLSASDKVGCSRRKFAYTLYPTDDFERTFAALPRCVPRALRPRTSILWFIFG